MAASVAVFLEHSVTGAPHCPPGKQQGRKPGITVDRAETVAYAFNRLKQILVPPHDLPESCEPCIPYLPCCEMINIHEREMYWSGELCTYFDKVDRDFHIIKLT